MKRSRWPQSTSCSRAARPACRACQSAITPAFCANSTAGSYASAPEQGALCALSSNPLVIAGEANDCRAVLPGAAAFILASRRLRKGGQGPPYNKVRVFIVQTLHEGVAPDVSFDADLAPECCDKLRTLFLLDVRHGRAQAL